MLMIAVLLAACLPMQSDAQNPVNPLSGVRINVNRQFHANGIVLAFPQRIQHLSSDDLIEFRLVGHKSGREKRSA